MDRHGHKLACILGDLKGKMEASSFDKISKSIKNVEPLEIFRYVDQKATLDIQTMQKGLEAVDYLVASLRENIDKNSRFIVGKWLRRYIEGSNDKDQNLLIDSFLRKNSSAKYWIDHLTGIKTKIDRRLKKYQGV